MNRSQSTAKILFLGKKDDEHCLEALKYTKEKFSEVSAFLAGWGEKFPQQAESWRGDYIISYLSRWILQSSLLDQAQKAAINFHPASPEYPGIGCNNFALYEEANEFGVTCHHMNPAVDTGGIIKVHRFPIHESDTVESLLKRTYDHQLELFKEIIDCIVNNQKLPESDNYWTRQPFTRKQLNAISQIDASMSHAEIKRRIRATHYKNFKPFIQLGDFIFEYKETSSTK